MDRRRTPMPLYRTAQLLQVLLARIVTHKACRQFRRIFDHRNQIQLLPTPFGSGEYVSGACSSAPVDPTLSLRAATGRGCHRVVPGEMNLHSVFSFLENRSPGADYTVRWEGVIYRVKREHTAADMRGVRVQLHGSRWLRWRRQVVALEACEHRPAEPGSGRASIEMCEGQGIQMECTLPLRPPIPLQKRNFLVCREAEVSILR